MAWRKIQSVKRMSKGVFGAGSAHGETSENKGKRWSGEGKNANPDKPTAKERQAATGTQNAREAKFKQLKQNYIKENPWHNSTKETKKSEAQGLRMIIVATYRTKVRN